MRKNEELFQSMPVGQALFSLAFPTVISQLIGIIYNAADGFFIGQIGDPAQVAAASLCLPLIRLINAVANLFGVGGSSMFARCLGREEHDRARKVAAFSLWGTAAATLLYGLLFFIFRSDILTIIGGKEDTIPYCLQYSLWTIALGSLPVGVSFSMAHFLRAEGASREASIGLTGGCILNMFLDPLFIFTFGLGMKGAAIATFLSNALVMVYFIWFIQKQKGHSFISLNLSQFTIRDNIPEEVIAVGLPSCLMTIFATVSNLVINRLMSAYGSYVLAGNGIARRIDAMIFGLASGIAQGSLPLVAYNYASGNRKRLLSAIKTSYIANLLITSITAFLLFTCAGPVVRAFIDDPATVEIGAYIQKVVCMASPCTAFSILTISMFQAMGQKRQPTILSVMRKGVVDIPFLLILNKIFGLKGIIWTSPLTDVCAMTVAVILFVPFYKKLRRTLDDET